MLSGYYAHIDDNANVTKDGKRYVSKHVTLAKDRHWTD